MNDFYDEPFNAWIDFNYCKRVNEKRTRPDEDFIEYFTAALDKVDKKELKKKKQKDLKADNITTIYIEQLSQYIATHHEHYDVSDSDESDDEDFVSKASQKRKTPSPVENGSDVTPINDGTARKDNSTPEDSSPDTSSGDRDIEITQ